MLKRNARTQRKRVKALTDPKPEFVSLVGAGANKTPFRALRAEGVEQDPRIDPASEEVSAKAETYAVARIEFDNEKFADEDTVTNWLSSGGYTDAKVERTDNGFVVAGEVADDAELIEIPGDGFTMYVTDVHPGATAQKSDEPESELRKKYGCCVDSCAPYHDDNKTVVDAMAHNTPPGLMDMTMALYDAMRCNLREGDTAGARAAVAEFSGLFDKLMEIFPGREQPTMKAFVDAIAPEVEMTKETETAAKVADTAAVVEQKNEAVETAAVETAEGEVEAKVEDEVEATAEATAEKAEGEVEAPAAEVEAVEGAVEETNSEDDAAVAAKSEEEAVDPIAALTALVGNLAQSVKDLGETVASKSDELAQRVAAVEDVRQTRKGADVDETTTSKSSERTVSDDMAELRQRSMLGMRG